jgi:hypothetical protein
MAEHRRGRPAAAEQTLQRTTRWLTAPSRDDPEQTNFACLAWKEQLEVDLLRREAERLLKTGKPTGDRKQ